MSSLNFEDNYGQYSPSKLPKNVAKDDFNHQVAGHTSEKLQSCFNKYVMKPRLKPDLFENEIKFYEYMLLCQSTLALRNTFIPEYFGIYQEIADGSTPRLTNLPYIVLEDLTLGYRRPNLVDIKMGQQTFEPTASNDKKNREILKYPFQSSVGFRITGFKAYDVTKKEYITVDKYFGRNLLPDSVNFGLALFFYNGVSFSKNAIRSVIVKLEEILAYMQEQTQYHYYCSSILIVYDSFVAGEDTDCGLSTKSCRSGRVPSFSPVIEVDDELDESESTEIQLNSLKNLSLEHPNDSFFVTEDVDRSDLAVANSTEKIEAEKLDGIQSQSTSSTESCSSTCESENISISGTSTPAQAAATIPDNSSSIVPERVTVKMIDFAHTIIPPTPDLSQVSHKGTLSDTSSPHPSGNSSSSGLPLDYGYIHGVTQLIVRLRDILAIVDSSDGSVVSEFVKNMMNVYACRME